MRFYLLFFLALSCALLHLSMAGVSEFRGLEAGHHRNSTGGPPRGGSSPPPRTTTVSSG